MSGSLAGARRVALVVGVYALGSLVVLSVAGWLRPVLALPPLFDTLLRGALLVGLVVGALMAWHYPRLAQDGEAPEREGPEGSA